jgi:hypothetical protein
VWLRIPSRARPAFATHVAGEAHAGSYVLRVQHDEGEMVSICDAILRLPRNSSMPVYGLILNGYIK